MTQLWRSSRIVAVVAGLSVFAFYNAPPLEAAPQRTTTSRARRAPRLSRAARAAREAMTPRFKLDEHGVLVPDVRAEAAIIFNAETGEVLWEEHAQDQRSIASITKVMTALVFLEDDPDLDEVITVTRPDVLGAKTRHLRTNEKIAARDLLHLALIASDNAAARVLARISHGGTASFVQRMNERAVELGLERTVFADPSGLNADNVSSAYDLSRLIAFAVGNEQVATIMQKSEYQFRTNRRLQTIRNTNRLVGQLPIVAGKTGFISKAGYCLASLLRLPQGPNIAVVVLGARSNLLRFWETRHLVNWLMSQADSLHLASGSHGAEDH